MQAPNLRRKKGEGNELGWGAAAHPAGGEAQPEGDKKNVTGRAGGAVPLACNQCLQPIKGRGTSLPERGRVHNEEGCRPREMRDLTANPIADFIICVAFE